jgi:hypothetical protein
MKRIVSGLMMAIWLVTIVGGCQSEGRHNGVQSIGGQSVSANFDTQIGKVVAYEKGFDSTKLRASVDLGIAWPGEEAIDKCKFSVGLYQQGEQKGLQATVRSVEGTLLWQYTLAVQKGEQSSFILTEKSIDDSLSVIVTRGKEQCTETYFRAGADPLVLSYPDGLVDRALQGLELSTGESRKVQDLAKAYQQWVNPHSTLNNNRYANLINALKNESDFAAYLGPAALAKSAITEKCRDCGDVCFWARTCAIIKCLIPGNPICWACTGVSLGCWLEDAWERISSWF